MSQWPESAMEHLPQRILTCDGLPQSRCCARVGGRITHDDFLTIRWGIRGAWDQKEVVHFPVSI